MIFTLEYRPKTKGSKDPKINAKSMSANAIEQEWENWISSFEPKCPHRTKVFGPNRRMVAFEVPAKDGSTEICMYLGRLMTAAEQALRRKTPEYFQYWSFAGQIRAGFLPAVHSDEDLEKLLASSKGDLEERFEEMTEVSC